MTDVADLNIRARADGVDRANRSLDKLSRTSRKTETATQRMNRENGRAVRHMQEMSKAGRSSVQMLGRMAVQMGLVVSAAVAIRSTFSTIAGFEQSMARVQAITRATEEEMTALTKTARDLGATTEFSASQAADALKFLGMAGFTASESMQAIPDVLNLSTAAALDLGTAADIASNIMSGFGIAATNASRVTDVLAAASSRANTDVQQLGDAMAYVGPVAAAMDIDIGDAAAAVGVLSDAGIQGSSAGTGLRRVLSSLANPTKEAARVIQEMGVQLEEVNPATNDLADIVETLAGAGISAADALTIFGDRGGPAILALVENNPRLRELVEIFRNVEGEGARMAETIRDTLSGDWKTLISSLQEGMLTAGENTEFMRDQVQGVTEVIRILTREIKVWDRANQDVADSTEEAGTNINKAAEYIRNFSRFVIIAENKLNSYNETSHYWGERTRVIAQRELAARTLQFRKAEEFNNKLIKLEAERFMAVKDSTKELETALSNLETAGREIASELNETDGINKWLESLTQASTVINDGILPSIKDFLPAASKMRKSLDDLPGPLGKSTNSTKDLSRNVSDATDEVEEFTFKARQLADLIGDEVIREVEELAIRFASVRDELLPQQAAVRELMKDYKAIMALGPGLRDAFIEGLKVPAEDATREVRKLRDEADPLAESWQEALNRIDNAFVELWKSAFDGFEDFADSLKNAFLQLLAELAHRATTQPILIAMGLDYGNGGNSQSGGLDDVMSLASFANALDSTPLAQIGDIVQEIGFNTGSRGIFDAGADLQNLTAKDIGLSALAGYAGSFVGNAAGEAIFNKEAESSYGAAAGGVIGGYVGAGAAIGGPWGAAIGAAIGALIDVFGGGDGKERVSLGVLAEHNARNNPNLDDVLGQSLKTASGLELSTYTKRIGEEGIAVAETMLQGMAAADAAITNIFSVLTGANQSGALAGETLRGGRPAGADTSWPDTFFGSAEFNEVNEAALAGATDQFIRSLVDRMNEVTNAGIDLQPIYDLQREGELLADVLLRVSNNFQPVNNTLEALGLTMYDLSTTGMAAADSLAQMFGGLEQFNTATSRYYQLFLTEQERLEHTATQVESVFGSLNVTMPDTVSGFRDIVEGLDVTTTQGQATFATLMRIAPAFHEVATAAGQAADDIANAAEQIFSSGQRNTIRDIAGTIFQTYEDRERKIADLQSRLTVVDSDIADVYRRMDDAMAPAIDTVESVTASIDNMGISASQLRSVADNILGLVDRLKLGELSPLTNAQQLQEARSQFEQARQAAEAGDASGLGSAAQSYLEQASTYFASSPAYVGIFNDVTRYLESMGTELDTQATAAERAERAREAQMQRLEAINQETANAANLAEYYGEIDRLMQEKQLIEQQLANLTATDSRVILDRQLQSLIDLNSGIQDMAHLLNVLPSGLALEIATVLGVSAIGGINLPGAANGGIANGPASGYPVMLHGREMITPLDGTEVKVDNREVVEELRATNDRLDRLENRLSEGNQQRGEGNRDRKGIRREVNRPSARTPGVTA